MRRAAIILALVALLVSIGADAKTKRDATERQAFCAETGFPGCHRPGYVVDHVKPLCAGGPDKRTNMQWQTVEDAKTKDRWERRLCRKSR